jgi:predicted small secreted protein
MKKAITIIALVSAGCVLFCTGCNSPAGPGTGDENTVEDITITLNGTYELSNAGDYPGAEIDLSEHNLADISKYESVTVNATLCDADRNTYSGSQENELGQFTLLKQSGNWDAAENKVASPFYNMVIDGNNTLVISQQASGVPGKLLVQTHISGTQKVFVIKVHSITFKVKTSDVVLSVVFGADHVNVAGNKITFTEASNSSGAALYEFPAEWLPLTNKTITVTYTLGAGYNTTKDHQLIIQAANGVNSVNHDGSAQQYKDMNDPDDATDTGTGEFTIDGTELENAARANSFTLSGFRIVNNGGTWTDTSVNKVHDREYSYSVTFNSITVQ